MINERRRWLYSKTVEPRIYEVGEILKGDLYDSPAFDDPRTKCVTRVKKEKQDAVNDKPGFDPFMTVNVKDLIPSHNGPPPEAVALPNHVGDPPEPMPLKKYPSQMNKTELIEHGKLIGLEFTDSMTAKEMRTAIHDAIKEEYDGKEDE